jgi:Zn-dependent M28 family amino/carboxypeptidase
MDAAAIRAHVEFLADDLLEGRGTGARGHEIAARYVAAVFRAAGLEPGGSDGTYLSPVPFRRATVDPGRASAAIVYDSRVEPLGITEFLASAPFGQSESRIEAPAVFVGFGVTARAFQYDDYDGVDVAGKVAVMLYGAPPSIDGDPGAHYSSQAIKSQRAGELRAVGVVVIPTEALLRIAPWDVIAAFSSQPELRALDGAGNALGRSPAIRGGGLVSPTVAPRLFAAAPYGWDEVREAATAGRPGSFDLGISLRLNTSAQHLDFTSPNVIGVLRGTDPALRDEYVLVTAHLDHDGIGAQQQGDSIYNGAVDNAAGIAALLEVARAFHRTGSPRRSVLFVATTAEEKGLLGAEYFALNPTVPIDAIVANVNLDGNHMLFSTRDILALGNEHSSLEVVAATAAARAGLELSADPMPEQNFFVRSDHYAFVRQGIPAVFLIGGFFSSDSTTSGLEVIQRWMGTVYHTPADDASQVLHYEAGVDYSRAAFFIVQDVANADQRPAWKPGNFFGEEFGQR